MESLLLTPSPLFLLPFFKIQAIANSPYDAEGIVSD